MPYQVSNLLQDLGKPVSAAPDEPIREALDRMLHHGFSQLPVVKGNAEGPQFYFITFESILLALHNFGSRVTNSGLRVHDALTKVPKVYAASEDLFELLIGMHETNAALIVDDERNLTHVVTSYDTSRYFRQWAEDIMQVRDIEHSLRRIINLTFKNSNDGIDEEARRAAVEEITSSNKQLRKKFGQAVKHYLQAHPASLNPQRADLAFVELVKASSGTGSTASDLPDGNTASVAGPNLNGEHEANNLLLASNRLRIGFETALKTYIAPPGNDLDLNETLADASFKHIYDRSERVKAFGELTLAEYIQMFFQERCWDRCKDVIKLTPDEVRHMLESVRDTRNDLAHFREDQITTQKRMQLKGCADWLNERERLIVAVGDNAGAI